MFTKLGLIFLSFFLLKLISSTYYPIFIILILGTITYLIAFFLEKKKDSKINYLFNNSVLIFFAIIIILNITGFVGTLTGSKNLDINDQDKIAMLFAAPFYLLSMGAYLTDVSKRKIKTINPVLFFLYISYPFKLFAGPIENTSLIQKLENIKLTRSNYTLANCWSWIALGLFMKFVISDRLKPTEMLYNTEATFSLISAFIFELKFYFDFAGYSFIAYGLSKAFGVKLTLNFKHPFLAPNVVQFWRRWHISLGRFLSRYILEAHIKKIKSHKFKLLFASLIFMISAMWHGGTLNYFYWGLFHGACYFMFIFFFKRKNVPHIIGYLIMIIFFIIGRFFAIDLNETRLNEKILNLFILDSYNVSLERFNAVVMSSSSEIKAISLGLIFILLEYFSIRIYGLNRPYHLFRKPVATIIITLFVITFAVNNSELLYARL